MKLLLDTNVLVDYFGARRPFCDQWELINALQMTGSSHAFRLFRGCPSRVIPASGAVSRGKTIAGSCLGAPDACFDASDCVRAVSSVPFRLRCRVVVPSEFDEMPGIFASTQASNQRE